MTSDFYHVKIVPNEHMDGNKKWEKKVSCFCTLTGLRVWVCDWRIVFSCHVL